MHDLKDLEGRGAVAIGIATSEFVEAAAAQNRALGYEPAVVFVAHPIQDRSNAELRALAEAAFDQVVKGLVK
jgi:hypothetical protein